MTMELKVLNAALVRRMAEAPATITAGDFVRDSVLEEASLAVEQHDRSCRVWVRGSFWDTLTPEAGSRIRVLNAAILDRPVIGKMLSHLGLSPSMRCVWPTGGR